MNLKLDKIINPLISNHIHQIEIVDNSKDKNDKKVIYQHKNCTCLDAVFVVVNI